MEKLPEFTPAAGASVIERAVLEAGSQKKKLVRQFYDHAGLVISIFLVLTVVLSVLSEVHLKSFQSAASLGLDFFILFFVSFTMYVNSTDSGTKSGLQTEVYGKAYSAFLSVKEHIIEKSLQTRLGEFCEYYKREDLKNCRMGMLASVGLTYEEYLEQYEGKDRSYIKGLPALSKMQKRAVLHANAIRPVRLSPELIMRHGKEHTRIMPLGTSPDTRRHRACGTKFFSSLIMSLAMSLITLEVIASPSWSTVATCILKLTTVVSSGVSGYKFGYKNIVFDATEYMTAQTELMHQAVHYAQSHPEKEEAGE